jgi:hypothetical protein
MLSLPQQRGILRSIIVKRLKSYDLKQSFKAALRANNQNVSGFLQRSISSTKFDSGLTLKTTSDNGILSSVDVSINIPWGRYGNELDEQAGSGAVYDPPDREFIERWIEKKKRPTKLTVNYAVKGGARRSKTYVNTRSSRSAMAYWVAKNIASEGEVRTRYNYVDEIRSEFELIVQDAVNEFYEEQALDFLGDVFVEIDNIF